MTPNQLFAQMPGTTGAPSIDELFKQCPAQFKRTDNPWKAFATKMRRGGGHVNGTGWNPKSKDPALVERQIAWVLVLGAYGKTDRTPLGELRHDAIAGWMLSEMLAEVPEYVPVTKST